MILRTIVFDIDDTLYLERSYVESGFRAVGAWVARELGASGFFEAAWTAFEQGIRGTTFSVALERLALPEEPGVVRSLVRVYREHSPSIELLPDCRACLDALRGRVAIAGITDGPLASQRAKAAALGLDQWLDPVIFTAELGPGFGKPNPRAFDLVARATSSSGSELVYIADNPKKDFAGPKGLGWRTIRVRREGSLHEEVDSGADVDIERADLEGLAESLLIGAA